MSKFLSTFARFTLSALLTGSVATVASAVELTSSPLFLNTPVSPIVMLNMSKDHQLFFKAYDDYSDVNGDGTADLTYTHAIDYYGYFDSQKCYNYTNSRFEPVALTTDKYCNATATGQWAGNFLNWATMTRMDAVRKILYGGLRSTDSATETVLQRAFLPNDAHSFAKYYNGTDLPKLAGVAVSDFTDTEAAGLTICNTTVEASGSSQSSTSAPLMRVVKGNYSLWAANERWQCRWSGEKSANNGNVSATTGIKAASSNPSAPSSAANGGDYNLRVKACVSTTLIGGENCKSYGTALKPTGLLQKFGDGNQIKFGLLTGSYGKNKSGGVLRKNVSSMTDEVNTTTDGTFKAVPTGGGIINTLNKLRLYGYTYSDGTYLNDDSCTFQLASFNNGACTNWGNPQAEIYLESLRYLAGLDATTTFSADDSSKITGLTTATWVDPVTSATSCAPLNIIQFNASTTSYDGDQLEGASSFTGLNVNTATDAIGLGEEINGKSYFVGESGSANNQLCTAKTVDSLSGVLGTCPDAPRLQGSYKIAGLAHHAHITDLRAALSGAQEVKTYGVALSPAVPQVNIPVPGTTKTVNLLPACRNTNSGGNCAIVDFKIVEQNHAANNTTNTGKLYVNWEDSEQGGDFDQDMWGLINYSVTSSAVSITTRAIAESTTGAMGFGYVLGGTTRDGFHVHSGIEGFSYTDITGADSCSNCQVAAAATTNQYDIGTATTTLLQQPLSYAAKWGGFDDIDNDSKPNTLDEWDTDADGIPDNYFFATNPADLEKSLNDAFLQVSSDASSSASVATNSTRLDSDTLIYQARFSSNDWSGQLLAYSVAAGGDISTVRWDTNTAGKIPAAGSRQLFTWSGAAGSSLLWGSLTTAQQNLLSGTDGATVGEQRLNWLRGERTQEQPTGNLRQRQFVLGDIVNSDPVFVGTQNYGYDKLPADVPGSTTYQTFVAAKAAKKPLLLVGANDGMVHGFNANTGEELFAYMPSKVFADIKKITAPDYGKVNNPHKYFVDGPLFVGDAYINGAWKTIAVGGYGAGYRGVYALDLTNAGTNVGFTAGDVLFEHDETSWTDIGNIFNPGVIGRLPDGTWGAVFGNGYNSQGELAKLLVINLNNPSGDKVAIATDSSGANGLAGPAFIATAERTLMQGYAGDLKGNLWRFNFLGSGNSAGDRSNWKVAYKSGNTNKPLFQARNASGLIQPITSVPELGYNPNNNNLMVFFGTGSYFQSADGVVQAVPQVETFYGLVDGAIITQTVANPRVSLQVQTITSEFAQGNFDLRNISNTEVDYTTKKGWYLDLIKPNMTGTAGQLGERVVSSAILRNGLIIFPTVIPSGDPCSAGGSSWLMELDAWNGGRMAYAVFDINGDGLVNENDMVSNVAPSGKKSQQGIIKTPAIISAGETEFKFASGTAGGIDVTVEKGGATEGRLSWRQLR